MRDPASKSKVYSDQIREQISNSRLNTGTHVHIHPCIAHTTKKKMHKFSLFIVWTFVVILAMKTNQEKIHKGALRCRYHFQIIASLPLDICCSVGFPHRFDFWVFGGVSYCFSMFFIHVSNMFTMFAIVCISSDSEQGLPVSNLLVITLIRWGNNSLWDWFAFSWWLMIPNISCTSCTRRCLCYTFQEMPIHS